MQLQRCSCMRAQAAAERDELLAPQLVGQAIVADEDHAEDPPRVEARRRQKAQFAEHDVVHLLGLVDEQGRCCRARVR